MSVHNVEQGGDIRYRAPVIEDGGELWWRPRFCPTYAFPRSVVGGHRLDFIHEEVLASLFSGGVVGVEIGASAMEEVMVLG